MALVKPYRSFAAIYDQVMDTVPYDDWVEFVDQLLQRHGGGAEAAAPAPATASGSTPQGPIHVLDACCGTGNISLRLARLGYQVTGIDQSEAMLEVAQAKATLAVEAGQLAAGSVGWGCQDIRSLHLPEPLDAAVCLYDSINYMLTLPDLAAAIQGIAQTLKPGGLFIFDSFQRWDADREIPAKQITQGAGWTLVWENHFDRANRQWRTDLRGVMRREGKRHRFTEQHLERAYTRTQIKEALTGAGLRLVGAFDGFLDRPATRLTERVVYLARASAAVRHT